MNTVSIGNLKFLFFLIYQSSHQNRPTNFRPQFVKHNSLTFEILCNPVLPPGSPTFPNIPVGHPHKGRRSQNVDLSSHRIHPDSFALTGYLANTSGRSHKGKPFCLPFPGLVSSEPELVEPVAFRCENNSCAGLA